MKREAGFIMAGILGIAASAGVSFVTGNIWAGLFTVLFISLIYLIWLDRKVIQSIESAPQKTAIRVLIVLLVFVQFFGAYLTYSRSQITENNLVQIRTNIDEGISKIRTQEVLLETLKHHASLPEDASATIASSFRQIMGDKLNDDGSIDLSESGVETDIHFEYKIISPEKVSITASAKIAHGRNSDFVNVSSQTGKYQAVATLTPNGISYEREN
ncbi:hypothetical protein [Rhodohalobacter sulfatireducens]|uniref:Uncharacterized protein n=1 Tax=Rhodohalobacter sulfatireducens TaxID=2911366 RepID=A0ABS9KC18_9BACT|nr:hypothetical protein [Rhodohalobacter sulfatireducens]MCG2588378.1 hypothetical protein [Rhodohalobacter sulfatireducens]